jgi:acyl carrier protein
MAEYAAEKLSGIKASLKELLVSELSLEDVDPADIGDDDILFGEGLGLDSLDAVEIVVLLQRNYNIKIQDMEQGREVLYSVDTLAKYIYDNADE